MSPKSALEDHVISPSMRCMVSELPSTPPPKRNPALSIANLITRSRSPSFDSVPALSSPTSSYSLYPSSSPPALTPPDSPTKSNFLPFSRKPIFQPKDDQGLLLLLAALESVERETVSCTDIKVGREIPQPDPPFVIESGPVVKIEDELESDITIELSASDGLDNESPVTPPTHDKPLMESTPILNRVPLCNVRALSEPIDSDPGRVEDIQSVLPSTPLPEKDALTTASPTATDEALVPNEIPSSDPVIDVVSMSSSTTELRLKNDPNPDRALWDVRVKIEDAEPAKLETRAVESITLRPASMGPTQTEQAVEIIPHPSPSLPSTPLSPVAPPSVLVSPPRPEANMIRHSSLPPVLSSSPTEESKANDKTENETSALPIPQHQRKRKRRTSNLENIDTTSRCETSGSTSTFSAMDDDNIVNESCSVVKKRSRKRGRRQDNVLSLSVVTTPSANGDHERGSVYEGDPCEGVDMCALLIDALVFGRVAFQSASGLATCILKDQPHLLERQDGWKWLELARKVLTESACFGRIARKGKDADGNKLEDTWYYEPSMDPDRGRAETLAEVAPSTKRRKAKMGDRTYFYAPVDMNRWVVAAELGEEA